MAHHAKLLEVTILSAEDLVEVSKNMKTYAIVWVQPDRKLTTVVDHAGGTNPVWNDKFSFRVNDKLLSSDDSKIVIEIYAAAWVNDALVGYVNVNINDIFHLRSVTDVEADTNSATRSVALQIRRPSGRPQGILNMEVALLDSTMRSLPLLEQPYNPKTTYNKENHEDDNHGSMVNGGSVCSTDVGPSASIVAAAVAKGLYKPPGNNQVQTKENLKINEWKRKEREQEELEMEIERWESDIPPPSEAAGCRKSNGGRRSVKGNTKLLKCFGIEIAITCGGPEGTEPKGSGNGNNNKVHHLSSVDDNYSQSIV